VKTPVANQAAERLHSRKEIDVRAAPLLCVDDLPHKLAIRKTILGSNGFSVQTAANPKAALRILEQLPIAAVLLEYKHEGMDAQAVASLIKQRFPNLPIILLSAYCEMPAHVLWPCDDYVMKGATTEELVHRIERLTKQTTATEQGKHPFLSEMAIVTILGHARSVGKR
jgi:CheY-like chemotaxis protein